jgi:hypothetical protein
MIGIFFLSIATASPAMVFDNSALLAPDAAAPSPKHRLFCHHPIVTGTRITPLVCKTAEEWSRNNVFDDSLKVVIEVKYHGMNQAAR